MGFCNIERLLPKLESRKAIPIFELSSNKGKTINLWDFKQLKNLLIIFHHGSQCRICRSKLRKIAKVYFELRKLKTEVLAVSTESLEKVKEQAKKDALPFHMLSDYSRKATALFTYIDEARNGPFPSIFITDRYGELRKQEIASEADQLLSEPEFLSCLLLLEGGCPHSSSL